jgi:hypothetical protein
MAGQSQPLEEAALGFFLDAALFLLGIGFASRAF